MLRISRHALSARSAKSIKKKGREPGSAGLLISPSSSPVGARYRSLRAEHPGWDFIRESGPSLTKTRVRGMLSEARVTLLLAARVPTWLLFMKLRSEARKKATSKDGRSISFEYPDFFFSIRTSLRQKIPAGEKAL